MLIETNKQLNRLGVKYYWPFYANMAYYSVCAIFISKTLTDRFKIKRSKLNFYRLKFPIKISKAKTIDCYENVVAPRRLKPIANRKCSPFYRLLAIDNKFTTVRMSRALLPYQYHWAELWLAYSCPTRTSVVLAGPLQNTL